MVRGGGSSRYSDYEGVGQQGLEGDPHDGGCEPSDPLAVQLPKGFSFVTKGSRINETNQWR